MTGKYFTPFPILKTERLTLRQLSTDDDKEILSLRSNKKINKYLGRKPATSIDDARIFIQTINENIERDDSVYWAITLSDIDTLIGTVCLFDFSQDRSRAEIGFELLPPYQGKGIMQEATSRVIHFAFLHLKLTSIEAYTHTENESSKRLLERLKFKTDRTADEKFLIFKLTAQN